MRNPTWNLKATAGQFSVCYVGKKHYFVAESQNCPVSAHHDQFGLAFALAVTLHRLNAKALA